MPCPGKECHNAGYGCGCGFRHLYDDRHLQSENHVNVEQPFDFLAAANQLAVPKLLTIGSNLIEDMPLMMNPHGQNSSQQFTAMDTRINPVNRNPRSHSPELTSRIRYDQPVPIMVHAKDNPQNILYGGKECHNAGCDCNLHRLHDDRRHLQSGNVNAEQQLMQKLGNQDLGPNKIHLVSLKELYPGLHHLDDDHHLQSSNYVNMEQQLNVPATANQLAPDLNSSNTHHAGAGGSCYRFKPEENELITEYLVPKLDNQLLGPNKIHQVNLKDLHPQWLADNYEAANLTEWYVFTPSYKKYPKGSRPDRGACGGYWRVTGVDTLIRCPRTQALLGYRTSLDFYQGDRQNAFRTKWKMHEYKTVDQHDNASTSGRGNEDNGMLLHEWILCKVYKKREGRNNTTQHTDANTLPAGTDFMQENTYLDKVLRSSDYDPKFMEELVSKFDDK